MMDKTLNIELYSKKGLAGGFGVGTILCVVRSLHMTC